MQTRGYLPHKRNLRNMKIDKKLTQGILNWTLKNNKQPYFVNPGHSSAGRCVGVPNMEKMYNFYYSTGFPIHDLIRIDELIVKKYKLENCFKEGVFGIFLSYSEKGHIVQKHKDPVNIADHHVVRFNFFLSKPEEGGLSIINREVVNVDENEVFICEASNYFHTSQEVKGDKPRIVLSFGYYLNNQELKNIRENDYR